MCPVVSKMVVRTAASWRRLDAVCSAIAHALRLDFTKVNDTLLVVSPFSWMAAPPSCALIKPGIHWEYRQRLLVKVIRPDYSCGVIHVTPRFPAIHQGWARLQAKPARGGILDVVTRIQRRSSPLGNRTYIRGTYSETYP